MSDEKKDVPPLTGQITWVYTRDLEAAERFYGGQLALREVYRTEAARIYACGPSAHIGVCREFDDRVVEPKGGMITLLTDDVDGWYAHLQAAGVPMLGPPERHARFAIYSFFALDPEGYRIEFQKFLDPAWRAT